MRILLTNNHLQYLMGSETFTHTLAKAAIEYGAEVFLHTFFAGEVSKRIFAMGVKPAKMTRYNLVLANHNSCVKHCHNMGWGPVVQTCHGKVPQLEQPSPLAARYVAITKEVQQHITNLTGKEDVPVIYNMIDTDRFTLRNPVNKKPKWALSLSKSLDFNKELETELKRHNITLFYAHYSALPVWEIEKLINDVDFVISLGRGVMEAMACGRQSMIIDRRAYQEQMADGMLTTANVDQLIETNFSGRYNKIKKPLPEMIDEMLADYNADDSEPLREWAMKELNYHTQFEKYLKILP